MRPRDGHRTGLGPERPGHSLWRRAAFSAALHVGWLQHDDRRNRRSIESISNANNVQSVTFQTPCEVPVGTATIVAQANGGTSTITGVPVLQVQPGVHSYAGPLGK